MYALEIACQEKPVKITSVYIGEENHWDDKTVQDHFVVTLEYQERKMTGIDYYMGIGHRIIPKNVMSYNTGLSSVELAKYKGKQVPQLFGDKYIQKELEKLAKPRIPKVEEVLNSLLLDSSALDITFEEWCSEYGYDTDSRKAEKTFNLCNELGKKLKRLLGEDYNYFMENNEY
jgi:hypothetical protein